MNHGSVIPSPESISDFLKGASSHHPAEIHRNLPWKGDRIRPAFADHVLHAQVIVIGHLALDLLNADLILNLLMQNVLQELLDLWNVERPLNEGCVADDPGEGAFESPDVAGPFQQ